MKTKEMIGILLQFRLDFLCKNNLSELNEFNGFGQVPNLLVNLIGELNDII